MRRRAAGHGAGPRPADPRWPAAGWSTSLAAPMRTPQEASSQPRRPPCRWLGPSAAARSSDGTRGQAVGLLDVGPSSAVEREGRPQRAPPPFGRGGPWRLYRLAGRPSRLQVLAPASRPGQRGPARIHRLPQRQRLPRPRSDQFASPGRAQVQPRPEHRRDRPHPRRDRDRLHRSGSPRSVPAGALRRSLLGPEAWRPRRHGSPRNGVLGHARSHCQQPCQARPLQAPRLLKCRASARVASGGPKRTLARRSLFLATEPCATTRRPRLAPPALPGRAWPASDAEGTNRAGGSGGGACGPLEPPGVASVQSLGANSIRLIQVAAPRVKHDPAPMPQLQTSARQGSTRPR